MESKLLRLALMHVEGIRTPCAAKVLLLIIPLSIHVLGSLAKFAAMEAVPMRWHFLDRRPIQELVKMPMWVRLADHHA